MIRTLTTAALLVVCIPASAQETTKYEYDALGRLVKSTAARGPTNTPTETVVTDIAYDPAGNRTSYKVSGSANGGSDTGAGASAPTTKRFVVVPLNGFTIIPIG